MMRITIDRSGGFANISSHRSVDTDRLPHEERAAIERLVHRALKTDASPAGMPDAYIYEVAIDGRRFVVGEAPGAWGKLIERIERTLV